MPNLKIEVDDLQPGEALVVIIKPAEYEYEDDDPGGGEEIPEEPTRHYSYHPPLRTVGGAE